MAKFFGILTHSTMHAGPGRMDRVTELRAGRRYLFVNVFAVSARPIDSTRPMRWVDFTHNYGDLFAVMLFNRWYFSVAVELATYSDDELREMGVLPPESFEDVVETLS